MEFVIYRSFVYFLCGLYVLRVSLIRKRLFGMGVSIALFEIAWRSTAINTLGIDREIVLSIANIAASIALLGTCYDYIIDFLNKRLY